MPRSQVDEPDHAALLRSEEILVVRRKQQLGHVCPKLGHNPVRDRGHRRAAQQHRAPQSAAGKAVVAMTELKTPERQCRECVPGQAAAALRGPHTHRAVEAGAEEKGVVGREAESGDGSGVAHEQCLRVRRDGGGHVVIGDVVFGGVRVLCEEVDARILRRDGNLRLRGRSVRTRRPSRPTALHIMWLSLSVGRMEREELEMNWLRWRWKTRRRDGIAAMVDSSFWT